MSKQKKLDLILYILLSVMSLIITILLIIPYTRETLINVLFSFIILIYLVFFLFKGVIKEKRVPIIIIDVVEIVLVCVILISICIPPIKITNDLKQILGLLLWLRGTSSILTKFFTVNSNRYRIITTSLDIVLITIGSILIASTSLFFKQNIMAYTLIVFTIILAIYGILMVIRTLRKQKKL